MYLILKVVKSAAEISEEYGLEDIELEYTDEDFQNLTTYKLFSQHIRPLIAKENPKLAMSKMVMLIGAKWRDFLNLNPNKEMLQEEEKPSRSRREGWHNIITRQLDLKFQNDLMVFVLHAI